MKIGQAVSEIEKWMIELRRYFHMYPELGFEEYSTARKISDELEKLNIQHTLGVAGTGVVALIEGEDASVNECIAIRADMDALPLQDAKNSDYKSRHKNKMHACGHDAHMAMLLGLAKILKQEETNLKGSVKLIFQPAEETDGGALPMIKAGVLENPKVDKIFGIHVSSDLDVGKVALKYGQIYARSCNFDLHIKGVSAHGAHPEKGVDAVIVSTEIVSNIQKIISRNINAEESCVITVGMINGGVQENVIAEKVNLKGTIRTLNKESMDYIKYKMDENIRHITQMHQASYSLTFKDGYEEAVNDKNTTDIVKKAGLNTVGLKNTIVYEKPSMGVEDMAYFLKEVPGCYFQIGVGKGSGKKLAHHSNTFDIDENGMKFGVEMYLNILKELGILL